ncbi:diacylglycerol kinase 4, partial [Quercus suber]
AQVPWTIPLSSPSASWKFTVRPPCRGLFSSFSDAVSIFIQNETDLAQTKTKPFWTLLCMVLIKLFPLLIHCFKPHSRRGFVEARADDGLLEIFGLKQGWHASFVMIELISAKHGILIFNHYAEEVQTLEKQNEQRWRERLSTT